MNKPWLSIVIPIYNPPLMLFKKCLDSIKLDNISYEVLIVDDGSDLKTQEFCLDVISDNIRYVRQNNSGVSAARNKGILEAKGEYIYFLDADDAISEEWCGFISSNYKNIFSDWILFDSIDYFPEKEEYKRRFIFDKENAKLKREDVFQLMLECGKLNECWGKLIKTTLLKQNNICFPVEITQGEDAIFNCKIILNSVTIEEYSLPSYIYRYELKNTQRMVKNPQAYLDSLETSYKTKIEVRAICPKDRQYFLLRLIKNGFFDPLGSFIVKVINANKLDGSLKFSIMNLSKKVIKEKQEVKDLFSNKTRVYYFFISHEFWFGFKVLAFFKKLKDGLNI